ncbi:MAG: S1C family serine protease [Candidatus Melainabacteria bacterium]
MAIALTALLITGSVWTAYAYTPVYDAQEQETISVYEKAARTVVTINALVNGQPSSGAGVIIDSQGLILTSGHVIGSATTAFVATADGQKYTGEVIGRTGDRADLAILRVTPAKPLPTLPLADSSQVKVGQKVLAIGHPYGFERTLTEGIISRIDTQRDYIQTDAAINPGNSGGPLLDTQGYIIGINVTIYNPNKVQTAYGRDFIDRTNIGIGFAVPANTIRHFLSQLASQPVTASGVLTASAGRSQVIRYNPVNKAGYENISVMLARFTRERPEPR